jgi:hypothetical protein
MTSGMCESPVAYEVLCVRFACPPLFACAAIEAACQAQRMRNTRYGWLVKPYETIILEVLPTGTFTLQEATSFACRTNA